MEEEEEEEETATSVVLGHFPIRQWFPNLDNPHFWTTIPRSLLHQLYCPRFLGIAVPEHLCNPRAIATRYEEGLHINYMITCCWDKSGQLYWDSSSASVWGRVFRPPFDFRHSGFLLSDEMVCMTVCYLSALFRIASNPHEVIKRFILSETESHYRKSCLLVMLLID